MPDTGAPWNIPYVESTDLVSDWPSDSLALANAIDAGLDAAGRLIDVKNVVKTDTQASSLASGANIGITGLTISHAVADASHKVLLLAQITGNGSVEFLSVALTANGTQLDIGAAASNRTQVGSMTQAQSNQQGNVFLASLYTPGSTSSITYGVDLINVNNGTVTNYVNRSNDDSNIAGRARSASTLTLVEVNV